MIIGDIESTLEPQFTVNIVPSKRMYTVSVVRGDNQLWSWRMLVDEIGYTKPAKKFIKFVKRKDNAPRLFLRRILNYIKQ